MLRFKFRPEFSTFLLRLSCVLVCVFVAIFVRVDNKEFVLSIRTGHFNFIDTDCYYYVRRLVHFIANFPNIMVFDPLLDWPRGGPVDWPEGFLVILGVPLKLFGVNSFSSLEIGVSVLMILLGLISCWVVYLASSKVIENVNLRILVLLFAACNFLLVRFSCLGQVDHHIMEAMFPPLIFYLALKVFEEGSMPSAVGLGLLLTYSLSISSSSIFVITTFYAAYGLLLGSRENFKRFLLVNAIFISTLLIYALWSIDRRGNPYADNFPSYFHVCLVLILATFSSFVAIWRRSALSIILAFAGLCFAFHFFNWPTVLLYPLRSAFAYVFGKSGVLQNVSEAFPIYASYDGISLGFMHINFGFLIYLLPLVWGLNLYAKRFALSERTLFFFLTAMSVPGIAQKRFSHLMVGLYLVFLAWLLGQMIDRLKAQTVRIGLVIVWAALTVGFPMYLGGLAPYGSPRDAVDLGTSQVFLDKIKVDQNIAWDRLAGKIPPSDGIWANPNMGHMLMYYTGLGTMNNSFYHPEGFNLDFQFRNIESTDELTRKLLENKMRYLILADDWQFFDLQFQLEGKSSDHLKERRIMNGKPTTVWNTNEFMKLAWVRLLLADEDFDSYRRLFTVQFQEHHYYNRLRGYELRAAK